MKKYLSLIIAVLLAVSPSAWASDGDMGEVTPVELPGFSPNTAPPDSDTGENIPVPASSLYTDLTGEPFHHNIDYDNPLTALVTATPVKDRVNSGDTQDYAPDSAVIDLVTETMTLPDGFTVAAYSLDGGQKWRKGAPKGSVVHWVSKDLSLCLANAYDAKTKKPTVGVRGGAEGATIIRFPKIAGRPKKEQYTVNYYIYADKTGVTTGQWTLSPKKSIVAADVSGLQIAAAKADHKTLDENGWGAFMDGQGINVKPKSGKTTYILRVAPIGGNDGHARAVSKTFKITALGLLKAPACKLNVSGGIIKLQRGVVFAVAEFSNDGGVIWPDCGVLTPVTKEEAKTPMPLKNDSASYYGKTLLFRIAAPDTGKKPASAVQVMTMPEKP